MNAATLDPEGLVPADAAQSVEDLRDARASRDERVEMACVQSC